MYRKAIDESVWFFGFLGWLVCGTLFYFGTVNETSAGLLNRLGSSSPVGLSMSGAGDTVGLPMGAGVLGLNPAALMHVEGIELYIGNTFVWTDFSLDQPDLLGGQHFEAKDEMFFFPEMAVAWRINEQWVIGAEVWVPYGLAADYSDLTPTFFAYNTELSVLQAAFAAAYQPIEDLSFGVSLNVDTVDLRFRLPTIIGGTFLGMSSGKADGSGVGASLGVLWTPGRWKLGIRYAIPTSVDIDGYTRFPDGLGLGKQDFSSEIDIPQRVAVGIAYDLTDWWTTAFDATYTDYNQSGDFRFDFDHLPANSLPLDWGSVWSFHAGNQFQVTEDIQLKQGVGWLSSGMPDDTLLPSIPDTPGWIVSGGIDYKITQVVELMASVAYAWGDRDIGFAPTRPASGDMDSSVWLAGIGFNFRF